MKLYRVVVEDDDPNRHIAKWFGTQAEWRAGIKALKADNFEIVSSKPIDVPVDKKGLLAWLNSPEAQL